MGMIEKIKGLIPRRILSAVESLGLSIARSASMEVQEQSSPGDNDLIAVTSRMFEKIRDQLVASDFRVELFNCKATQCVSLNPMIHEGIGVVTQGKDGTLEFALLCQKIDARFDSFVELFDNLEPGKMVEDKSRYTITGHDSLGIRWRSERQMLSVDQGQELRLTSDLTHLVAAQASPRGDRAKEYRGWYFRGDMKLPIQPKSKVWEHEVGPTSWKGLVDTHGNTELSFHALEEGSHEKAEDFLRGIAILCGRPLSAMCRYHFFGDRQTVEIYGRRRGPNRNVMVPFVPRAPHHARSWNQFLEAWLAADQQVGGRRVQTFIFHHFARVCFAYQEGIENGAQVLSSSIEGMLAGLFLSDDDKDLEFVRIVDETLTTASASGFVLDGRVVDLLEKNRANASRPGIKSVFHRLIHRGILDKKLFEAWNKIRHKAAHGELLGTSDSDHQKIFDRFFACVETFKRLTFEVIGYDGTTNDYHLPHWPQIPKSAIAAPVVKERP